MSALSYDTAQICINGHSINSSSVEYPEYNQDYCSQCGKKTIQECQDCHSPIKGHLKDSLSIAKYEPPSYCHKCGSAYPWTELMLEAAKELADELEGLNDEEIEKLKESIDDLVTESPKTELAIGRFKRIMKKVGSEGYDIMKSVLINVVSEGVRKSLFG